ncbi:MAG TPA: dihydrolipoyl dehydrogenase [Candidatus Limnocylindria bacterium]|jgi:dihydrolipoamide dehydrogenase|nr:dihydrolipoyl dehydrogenase [Candidatus Limnocylindria bacterium]
MTETQQFDLLILGGGMSYVGAIRAAQLGLKVGLVERDKLGGTCLNRGCIPSKALLETADLLHRVVEQGAEFGLAGHEGISLDYPALGARRDQVVDKHVKGVEFLMKKNAVTVIRGNGTLTGPTSLHVSGGESGELDASATDLMLATGSAPRSLPGLDIEGERIITSDEALTRGDVPKRVTIVGAGAIGVEWASIYRDFGTEVTMVEFLDRVVPLEDADVSKELNRVFRKRGITMHTASTIDTDSIRRTDDGLRFTVKANEGDQRTDVEADVILVAVGRRPLTDGIGLEEISGVELERGYVKVDGHMRTGVEHLYAIGDIVPGFALAHVAAHEAVVAVETIAGHDPQPVDMGLMPRVTFCRPQIASVGMTEAEARQAGREPKVGSFPFRALGKATIVGEVDGFAKLVADAETDVLLGAHIIGPHAGDLLAEPTFARLVEGTAAEIAMSVHAHPTLTEVLAEAALAVDGAAIHV